MLSHVMQSKDSIQVVDDSYILAASSQIKISLLSRFSVMKDTSIFLLLQLHLVWVLIARRFIGQSILAQPKM